MSMWAFVAFIVALACAFGATFMWSVVAESGRAALKRALIPAAILAAMIGLTLAVVGQERDACTVKGGTLVRSVCIDQDAILTD